MWNKRKGRGGRILAAVMAVLFLTAVFPAGVLAQEQTAENEVPLEKSADQQEKMEVLQNERLTEEENSTGTENEETSDGTDQSEDEAGENPEIIPDIVIPVVIPMTEGEQYEQLSAFLSLSSDRFEIYIASFLDACQNQVQPEEPVQIFLDIPEDFDIQRLAVSEITADGSTPVRTELPFEVREGKALVNVGHAGVYVVMEKKIMQELPSYLEPTSKVEKLTLTGDSAATKSGYLGRVNSSVPLTGDDSSVVVWLVIMAAAVAAVIFITIRKKK